MAISFIKIERLVARLLKTLEALSGTSGQVYVQDRVAEYRSMWQAIAKDAGAQFSDVSTNIWEIEMEGRKTRILNDILEFDNYVILEMAGMKPLMYGMFGDRGLPVPEYLVFGLDRLEAAYRFLRRFPTGCVIKPAKGTSSGQGVTTHIVTPKEARKAAILASLYDSELLMEPMIPGECHRLLVLKGEMIHAVCRRGPRLEGDGKSNVSQLIRSENTRRAGMDQPQLDIDADCRFTLGYQEMTLDSIPDAGHLFLIKSVNESGRKKVEVRTVYNETVTDSVCHSIRQVAEKAARILNSDFVGVDFITKDIKVPLEQTGGVINEVNTTPGLHHHYDVATERYPRPAMKILQALLND